MFNRADGDPQQTSIVLGEILDQADVWLALITLIERGHPGGVLQFRRGPRAHKVAGIQIIDRGGTRNARGSTRPPEPCAGLVMHGPFRSYLPQGRPARPSLAQEALRRGMLLLAMAPPAPRARRRRVDRVRRRRCDPTTIVNPAAYTIGRLTTRPGSRPPIPVITGPDNLRGSSGRRGFLLMQLS